MADIDQLVIFLGAAVALVPLVKRLGLGSVLGYLIAGTVIGPWGFRLIRNTETILDFAEFGVVFLLFLIGLQLQPSRLWLMRRSVFGLGGAQLGITGLVIAAIAHSAGLSLEAAIAVGFGLALSSTAFAIQVLSERGELMTRFGRSAFSILLFQDVAAIPIIALVPLLGVAEVVQADGDPLIAIARTIGVLVGVVFIGRYALRWLFRMIAMTRTHEVFTAASLFVVTGVALLVDAAGLSMALGAFLAGVLLADSEYRHQVQADIEPFKGLLMGLFFIAVGMSLNLDLLAQVPLLVIGLVSALLAVKHAILFIVAKIDGLDTKAAVKLAFVISQGGEFAFVIFGAATGAKIMDPMTAELLVLVVTLSMAATPILLILADRLSSMVNEGAAKTPYDVPPSQSNQVIIAGFGRVGQIVGRVLQARKIGFTALEISPDRVDFVKKFGNKIYYGDPCRIDVLRAAQADEAEIFIIAIDDIEDSVRTAETVKANFPHLKIYARARNRSHAYLLMDAGVQHIVRETYWSSLKIAEDVLIGLGMPDYVSRKTVDTFREHDEKRLVAHREFYPDDEQIAALALEWAKELEELFEQDAEEEVPSS